MGFGDAIRTCFSKYIVFEGRASRPEYWWFFLFYFIVYAVAAVVDTSLDTGYVVAGIVGLVFFLPLLAAAIRRLHDTGRRAGGTSTSYSRSSGSSS